MFKCGMIMESIFDERSIKAALANCVQKINEARSPPICSFTTENRDVWAAIREKIIAAFPVENQVSFEKINDSLFAVSLEDADPTEDDREPAKVSLHGFTARNRWFDKCINFWVCPGGKAGSDGEHSHVTLSSPTRWPSLSWKLKPREQLLQRAPEFMRVEHLEFKVTPEVMEALTGSRVTAEKSCAAMDLLETRFEEFGAANIRGKLGVGPDGFSRLPCSLRTIDCTKS